LEGLGKNHLSYELNSVCSPFGIEVCFLADCQLGAAVRAELLKIPGLKPSLSQPGKLLALDRAHASKIFDSLFCY
jgi:hypothetical protein